MRYRTLAVAGLLVAVSVTHGQSKLEGKESRLELRHFVGAYLPIGDQARAFMRALTFGVQASWEFAPSAHAVAALSWTDGRSELASVAGFPRTHIWQYDVGAELHMSVELSPKVELRPFMGVGAGARNYDYRDKGIRSSVYPAGYYSLGSELRRGLMGLRLEARTYLSSFRAPLNPQLYYREDIFVTLGLTYHL